MERGWLCEFEDLQKWDYEMDDYINLQVLRTVQVHTGIYKRNELGRIGYIIVIDDIIHWRK